jgi:hypothetical protein
MSKLLAIIIMVVSVIVASSLGILISLVLNKRFLQSPRTTSSIVFPTAIGVILLIIVALVIIIFFPQFVHT